MTRKNIAARAMAVLLAGLFAASPALSQTKKAIDLVPDEALGCIVIKDLAQLSVNVEAVAKAVKAPAHVSLLELIKTGMGLDKGLNQRGSAVFMFLKAKSEKDMPAMVFAVPVSDAKQVLAKVGVQDKKDEVMEGKLSLPSELLVAIGTKGNKEKQTQMPVVAAWKGDFVLLAAPDHREALQQVIASRKSMTAAVQDAQEWLDEQDIAGVCSDHGVKVGLAMFMSGVISSTKGQYAGMKATFADLEKNVRLITFGARIEREGHSRLLTRVYFQKDGPFARWLSKAQSLEETGLLSMLPEQNYLAAALCRFSAQANFEGLLSKLYPDKLPSDKSEELAKVANKLIHRIQEVGVGVYGPERAEEKRPPDISVAAVLRVDNSADFADSFVDFLKRSCQAANDAGVAKGETKVETKKIADKPARLVTIIRAPSKDQKGHETPLFLVELDTRTLLIGGVNKPEQLEPFVKRFTPQPAQSLEKDKHIATTRKILPAKLQTSIYLNLHGLVNMFNLGPDKMPACAPLAFTQGTFANGIEAEFVVPFDTLAAVFRMVQPREKK